MSNQNDLKKEKLNRESEIFTTIHKAGTYLYISKVKRFSSFAESYSLKNEYKGDSL